MKQWVDYKQRLLFTGIGSLFIVAVLFGLAGCETESGDEQGDSSMTPGEAASGETFAKQYCTGCHTFPEPGLLDRKTWREQTLPSMGPHLGIREYNGETYPLDETDGLPENFYPEETVINEETWEVILSYYESESPERVQFQENKAEIQEQNHIFDPRRPSYRTNADPMVSAVRFDPGNGLIFVADATVERLLVFNRQMEIEASFELPSPISHIRIEGNAEEPGTRELVLSHIASISPSDAPDGSIISGQYNPESTEGSFDDMILDNIRRPVETLSADLNGDGLDDLLVNEFGHRRGSVFWLKNSGNTFESEKQILTDIPGCLRSKITDFNGNGHPDVLSLCSQVDQKILLFENDGTGTFERSVLMQFPVTYGSSSFELTDFNGDGHPDILYTSGDNADYSMVYKPYHGVYLYLNDGENNFEQKWFYHVNGAYDVKARDFNGNGLMDIALIAFFADYAQNPQEGFIYFENEGDGRFTPYHPQESSYGRWIAMDVADWTGNGRDDILLGNFSRGPTKVLPQIENILTQSPHILVLENRGTK